MHAGGGRLPVAGRAWLQMPAAAHLCLQHSMPCWLAPHFSPFPFANPHLVSVMHAAHLCSLQCLSAASTGGCAMARAGLRDCWASGPPAPSPSWRTTTRWVKGRARREALGGHADAVHVGHCCCTTGEHGRAAPADRAPSGRCPACRAPARGTGAFLGTPWSRATPTSSPTRAPPASSGTTWPTSG